MVKYAQTVTTVGFMNVSEFISKCKIDIETEVTNTYEIIGDYNHRDYSLYLTNGFLEVYDRGEYYGGFGGDWVLLIEESGDLNFVKYSWFKEKYNVL